MKCRGWLWKNKKQHVAYIWTENFTGTFFENITVYERADIYSTFPGFRPEDLFFLVQIYDKSTPWNDVSFGKQAREVAIY